MSLIIRISTRSCVAASSRQLVCSCGSSIHRHANQWIATDQPSHACTIVRVDVETVIADSHLWIMREARSMRKSLKRRRMRTSLIPLNSVPVPPPDAHLLPNNSGAYSVIESKGRTVRKSMKNHPLR